MAYINSFFKVVACLTLPNVELDFFVFVGYEFGVLYDLLTDFCNILFLCFVNLFQFKFFRYILNFNFSKIAFHHILKELACLFGVQHYVFQAVKKVVELLLQIDHILRNMLQMFERRHKLMGPVFMHAINTIHAKQFLIIHAVKGNNVVMLKTTLFLIKIVNKFYEFKAVVDLLLGYFGGSHLVCDLVFKGSGF